MTKWKKAVSVLLIVATLGLMVSGCGKKTATTENTGSSKETAEKEIFINHFRHC